MGQNRPYQTRAGNLQESLTTPVETFTAPLDDKSHSSDSQTWDGTKLLTGLNEFSRQGILETICMDWCIWMLKGKQCLNGLMVSRRLGLITIVSVRIWDFLHIYRVSVLAPPENAAPD